MKIIVYRKSDTVTEKHAKQEFDVLEQEADQIMDQLHRSEWLIFKDGLMNQHAIRVSEINRVEIKAQ